MISGPQVGNKVARVYVRAQWLIMPAIISSFRNMKRLPIGVFLLQPWMELLRVKSIFFFVEKNVVI